MSVLTVYCHGTGGSRLKKDSAEIVNIFGNADPGKEYENFIIAEGVGSKGEPHNWELKVQDGKLVRVEKGKVVETVVGVALPPVGLAMLISNSGVFAKATGKGVEQNVKDVCLAIDFMIQSGKAPTKINMMGWSRGAVTCIRIAYQLFTNAGKFLSTGSAAAAKKIPVNIFAVDPVAGLGNNSGVDGFTLNDNVNNYVATLSIH
jgi:hypothetical protein